MKKRWMKTAGLYLLAMFFLANAGCAAEKNQTRTAARQVDLSRGMMLPRGTVDILRPQEEKKSDQPRRVLIYHTHTYEAYLPDENDPYVPTEEWRSADAKWNVTAVGKKLAEELRRLGFEVVHDDTAFEPPELEASYLRSLEALENYHARGERFDLYIDLHRDAYAGQEKNTVETRWGRAARVMLLIGNGEGSWRGKAYDPKPDWEKNLLYARQLTEKINAICPDMARAVSVKTGRYNQHVSERAILLEAGNNFNTLEEALLAMPVVARAIAALP